MAHYLHPHPPSRSTFKSEWPPTHQPIANSLIEPLGFKPRKPIQPDFFSPFPPKDVLSLLNPSYDHFSALRQDGKPVNVSTIAVTVLRVPHHKPSPCVNIADVAKRTKMCRLARSQSSHSKIHFCAQQLITFILLLATECCCCENGATNARTEISFYLDKWNCRCWQRARIIS